MKKYTPLFILLALLVCLMSLTACEELFIQTGGTAEDTTAESTPEETTTEAAPETTLPQTTEPETSAPPELPKKRVALTFDDGPSRQGLTVRIVDEFKKYGGKATFFMLGNLISSATGEALAYAQENGFEIGIHGYTHDFYFDTCTEEEFLSELALTREAIERYTNTEVTLLRPPGGRITRERAIQSGYPIIFWSVDTEDWLYQRRPNEETIRQHVDTIVENAIKNIEDGDIVLLHEIYMNSFEATCLILERLHEMGFEFVTVTELLGEESLTAGSYIYSKTDIK